MDKIIYEAIIYVEILSAIIASIYFYKYRESNLKFFIYFIWYTAINELIGKYLSDILGWDNTILYNIYLIIYFLSIFFIYWKNLSRKTFKNITLLLLIIYSIIFIVNLLVSQNFTTDLQVYPFLFGSSFLIITVILYFIEILHSEKILVITKELLFWISLGLLLFNIGIIPWLIMLSHFTSIFIENFTLLNALFYCLIIILNICYIIGFIWGHKKQKQQQS